MTMFETQDPGSKFGGSGDIAQCKGGGGGNKKSSSKIWGTQHLGQQV